MSRFRHNPSSKTPSDSAEHLLFKLFLSEKINIRSFLIYTITSGIFLLAIPFGIQILVQHLSLLYYNQSTLFMLLCISIFLAGIGFMRGILIILNERFQRRLFHDLAYDFNSALKTVKESKLSLVEKTNHFFEIVSLQKTSSYLVFEGLSLGLQIAFGLIIISLYHSMFFLYSVCTVVALYYVLRVLGRGVFDLALKESAAKYKIVAHLQHVAAKDHESTYQIDDLVYDYLSARDGKFQIFFKQSLGLILVQIVASCLLLAIGGVLVVSQNMTLGQFVAGELIISNVLISMFKFTNVLDYWYDSLVSVYKIDKTLKDFENAN